MPDKRTEKLEPFRLSKSQKEFQKQHKTAKRILQLLQAKGFDELRKLQNTNQLMQAWKITYDQMMEGAPQSGVSEIPGMRFPSAGDEVTDEQATIRY